MLKKGKIVMVLMVVLLLASVSLVYAGERLNGEGMLFRSRIARQEQRVENASECEGCEDCTQEQLQSKDRKMTQLECKEGYDGLTHRSRTRKGKVIN